MSTVLEDAKKSEGNVTESRCKAGTMIDEQNDWVYPITKNTDQRTTVKLPAKATPPTEQICSLCTGGKEVHPSLSTAER